MAWFEDVTERTGIQFVQEAETSGHYLFSESLGAGAAFFDFDNDGRMDLYLIHNVSPSARVSNRLFQQQPDGRFRDVSDGSGLDVRGHGNGVAVGDINNDGLPDLLLTEYDRIRLFLNEGNGKFSDVTVAVGLTNDQWSIAAAFFDYDRDGWLDLVVGNYLDFDPTQKCFDAKGEPDFCGPHGFRSTITRLYHNLGGRKEQNIRPDGTARRSYPNFEDVTVRSGFARAPGKAMAIVCADFDADGFPDIFITDDGLPNRLFMNQRDGTFKEEAVQRGVAYTAMGSAPANMGIAIGDVDNDGLLDLFVPHLSEENHTFWRQGPRGLFQDETARTGLLNMPWHGTGFAAVFADFNCDGALDLALANGRIRRPPSGLVKAGETLIGIAPFWRPYAEPAQLFANDGSGHFREISSAHVGLCGRAVVGRSLACADFDNDGGLDLLLTGIGGPAQLFRNVAIGRRTSQRDVPTTHWIGIRAILPTCGGRDAYGAEIVVEAGGRRWWRQVQPCYGYGTSNDPRVHIGLGAINRFDSISVRWPDGSEEKFPSREADRYLVLRQSKP